MVNYGTHPDIAGFRVKQLVSRAIESPESGEQEPINERHGTDKVEHLEETLEMKHTNHRGPRIETHKARPLTTETPFARKRANETPDARHESQRDTKHEPREQ